MTKEDAIKELRGFIGQLTEGCQEAIKVLVPELKESEDEKARKWIYDYIRNCPNESFEFYGGIGKKAVLAYLEKQKEQKLYEPKNWPADKNNLTQEQKPIEWKPQPESLEALMYAIEGKWEMIKPTSYNSRRLEDLYDGLVNTYNVDETRLAELPKTAYSAKDIEELKALKDKIDASIEQQQPVDLEKEIKKHTVLFHADIEYPLRLTALKFYELGKKGGSK